MRKNYIENIFLQKMEILDYQEVFKESTLLFKSAKLLSYVIKRMSMDHNETNLKLFLKYLYKLYKSEYEYVIITKNVDLKRILFTYSISNILYEDFCLFFSLFTDFKYLELDADEKEFFSLNLNNLCIYKKITNNYSFDVHVLEKSLNTENIERFYELYKKITTQNMKSYELENYYNKFENKNIVDNFLAIMNKNIEVNEGIDRNILLSVDPLKIPVTNVNLYVNHYLCYLNSGKHNKECALCGTNVQNQEKYFKLNKKILEHSIFLKCENLINNDDPKELNFFIMHLEKARTKIYLEKALKYIFSEPLKNSYLLNCLEYFSFEKTKNNEDVICDILAYIRNNKNESKFLICLKIVQKINLTERIIINLFILLFEYFISLKNEYIKLMIKNTINYHKEKFERMKKIIIEYYIEVYIKEETKKENIFVDISDIFSLEKVDFIENNIFYILPKMFIENLHEKIDLEIFDKGIPFLVTYLIENNLFEFDKDFLYLKISDLIRKYGFCIFTILLCRDHKSILCLENFFEMKLEEFVLKNISPILFKLRYFYKEKNIEFKFCIFQVFKYIFDLVPKKMSLILNHMIPFLEYFHSNNEIMDYCVKLNHIENNCKEKCIKELEKIVIQNNNIKTYPGLIHLVEMTTLKNYKSFDELIDKIILISNSKSKILKEKAIERIDQLWNLFFIDYNTKKKITDIRNNEENIIIRSFCNFIDLNENSIIDEKINQLLYNLRNNFEESKVVSRLIGKIGYKKGSSKEFHIKDNLYIYLEDFSIQKIAITAIEEYLVDIDHEIQDTYFFVIQETLKFIGKKEKIKKSVLKTIEQFFETKYTMETIYDDIDAIKISKNTSFHIFLDQILCFCLTLLRNNNLDEFHNLIKLSLSLKSKIREFYCFCAIRKIIEQNIYDFSIFNDFVSDNNLKSLDYKILNFLLKCNVFCYYKLLNTKVCINICILQRKYHYLNRILEIDFKNEKYIDMFLLQYSYYQIYNFDNCKGINDIENKIHRSNIFFELCLEKKFTEAKKILDDYRENIAEITNFYGDILGEDKKNKKYSENVAGVTSFNSIFMGDDKIYDLYDNKTTSNEDEQLKKHKTNNILKEIEVNEIDGSGIIKDKGTINKKSRNIYESTLNNEIDLLESVLENNDSSPQDTINIQEILSSNLEAEIKLSKWESSVENNTCLKNEHILFDCDLIKNTDDLKETLKTIAIRRKSSNLNFLIINKHIEIADFLLKKTDITSDAKKENIEREISRDLEIIITFKDKTLLDQVKMYRKQKNYIKCKEEINNMLLNKKWIAFYELAKYNLIYNKKNDARNILKKLIITLERNDLLFEKATILQARLINNKEGYDEASRTLGESEKLLFYIAKFYEAIDPLASLDYYMKSLSYGNKYINETLPKIIHLFSGMPLCKDKKLEENTSRSTYYIESCRKMEEFLDKMDILFILPFFNAMISKISHNDKNVISIVKKFLMNAYKKYPHKTLWPSLILINSTQKETAKNMKEIIEILGFETRVLLKNLTDLSVLFCKISTFNAKDNTRLSMTKNFKRELNYKDNVVVPNTDLNVKIVGFMDDIRIFFSLQSPKRITLIGENGFLYSILCKPNDDLRRDSRFMDLNKMMNHIFRKDNETSKRNLYIRIYNVVPINSKNGVIEWIDGLESLKGIIDPLYRKENIIISDEQKKYKTKKKIELNNFKDAIKRHPPILYKYFNKENDPYKWYSKKQKFIKSYAVMNIIGWFMGLGDRHLENIMIDSLSGDTFHVDLNCIFEKAKKLEIPERVPFRLTQNIVDVFGPLKIDGLYRKTMEICLDVMIKNKDLIMSNLLSFVYDPLQEWKVGRKTIDESAKILLNSLNLKLSNDDVSLVVDKLIGEATNEYNLSMMYIGWCSFV